jgi:alkylation response protein AidB-like acyl-CoA dehydrogenase
VEVPADAVLGEVGAGFDILEATVDEATLAVCAEAVGILRTMHDKTVDYSRNRVQFGMPVGSFQALQHRMVDTLMACEQLRSLLLWATMVAANGGSGAAKAISALKFQVGNSGRLIAQEAVQIHGGMGVTWELDIAHFFKRFTAIETLFGNSDYHLDRYIARLG